MKRGSISEVREELLGALDQAGGDGGGFDGGGGDGKMLTQGGCGVRVRMQATDHKSMDMARAR